MEGYGHSAYSASLSELGKPRHLQQSDGWLLERPILGCDSRDAMGCYPLFVCSDWSRLGVDLQNIGEDLICLSLVTDPFGEYDVTFLRECFPDVTMAFKEHFIVDLSRPLDSFVHSHHRRNARRALSELQVEQCASPIDFLDDWIALYGELVERHDITGPAAFSRASFAKQLVVPGMVAFRAVHDEATVGMLLWYEQGSKAYYHLGAYSPLGYQVGASFALFDRAIRYFAEQQLEWLNLGAGAGLAGAPSGLNRFKQGWSTGTRTAYFCGRVFDHKKYQELVIARNVPATDYFPAYRLGEFS
jgi:hypothetical protein